MADKFLDPVRTDATVSLLWGDAEILKHQAAQKIIDAWLEPADREWGLVTISGAQEIGRVGAEMNDISLLTPRKVIVVHGVQSLNNAQQKQLAAVLAKAPEGVRVILLATPDPDSRAAKGAAPVAADLRKVCEGNGQIVPFVTPYERELGAWVVEVANAQGKRMTADVGHALVETAGADMDRLYQEITKLVTYVGHRAEITRQDVSAVACRSGDTDVFALVDAIGKRDARAALDMLPRFLPASAPSGAALPILAMISRQLRLIWQARMVAAAGANLENLKETPAALVGKFPENQGIMGAVKGRRFLAQKYSQQARNFSDEALAKAMEAVYETDLALKGQSGEQMDDRMAMELLIVSLCAG